MSTRRSFPTLLMIDVPCSRCDARAGEACRTMTSSKSRHTGPHLERKRRWREHVMKRTPR